MIIETYLRCHVKTCSHYDREIFFFSRNILLRLRYHYCKYYSYLFNFQNQPETLLFILTLVADKKVIADKKGYR